MLARVVAVILIAATLASAQTKAKAKAKAPAKAAPAPPAVVVPTRTLPPPKDESGRDKTLAAFFVKLKDVLKRKDREGLLALLDPSVDIGVRDMSGPGAFFTAWALNERDASVYGVISQILSLPGVWVDAQFCAPYVSVQFPKDLDRSKHQVVLNFDTRLRATPSTTGKVIATLAYEIVEVLERNPEWTKVRTVAGQEGYVQIAYLYSPAGYRACFSKNPEGAWRIQALAVGR
ncbi:MAG: SH3 domain-containing protein [Bryobacteraceae bacterium]